MAKTKYLLIKAGTDRVVGEFRSLDEVDRCFESYVNRYGWCRIQKI